MAKTPSKPSKLAEPLDFDPLIKKHLDAPKAAEGRKARTLYLSDENYLPAKEILGSNINQYVDDCLDRLVKTYNWAHKPD